MQDYYKVGVLALLALIALGMVIMWKSDFVLKRSGYQLIGSFTEISGLTVGSEVRYRGLKVGKVMRIDPGLEDIRVYAIIDRHIEFPSQSRLRVAFDGLVGMKYLEIIPVKSEFAYRSSQILTGESTSGIVDFVDIGARNLEETKKILTVIREILERPDIQRAFVDAVLNIHRASVQINELTAELRRVARSIDFVVSDPKFQTDIKGIFNESEKTLTSANQFFESLSNLQLKPSGEIKFGNVNNEIRANIDIVTSKERKDYYRIGIGEGPAATQGLSLQDVLIARQVSQGVGLRIGMMNSSLGGGVEFYPSKVLTLTTDLYKINNNPNYPKLRITAAQEVADFLDITVRADDVLNYAPNYSVGLSVKSK